MAAERMTQWVKTNPNQLLAMGVAVLILGLAGWTGLRARAAAADLVAKRRAWDETASRLATIQQQFRVPTSTESATLIAESSRMGALGVPEGEKMVLVDMVGRLAEACDLGSVRVNTRPASDSAYVAEREVAGTRVKPADYAVAVEFVGSFANAHKFVSSLPPSVSLSRFYAARRNGGALYQLILSVYEVDAKPGD